MYVQWYDSIYQYFQIHHASFAYIRVYTRSKPFEFFLHNYRIRTHDLMQNARQFIPQHHVCWCKNWFLYDIRPFCQVQFLPFPKHETCLCCSAMSGLMKLACLSGCRAGSHWCRTSGAGPAAHGHAVASPGLHLDLPYLKALVRSAVWFCAGMPPLGPPGPDEKQAVYSCLLMCTELWTQTNRITPYQWATQTIRTRTLCLPVLCTASETRDHTLGAQKRHKNASRRHLIK